MIGSLRGSPRGIDPWSLTLTAQHRNAFLYVGHMVYAHGPVLNALRANVAAFVEKPKMDRSR
jgi:hypothetical protein